MNRGVETIPSETMNTLVRYDWRGNIRELQNVIERAVIVSTGPVLKAPLDELRTRIPSAEASNGFMASEDTGTMRGVLEEAERKQILAALVDWANIQTDPAHFKKLAALVRFADDDPWCKQVFFDALDAPLAEIPLGKTQADGVPVNRAATDGADAVHADVVGTFVADGLRHFRRIERLATGARLR